MILLSWPFIQTNKKICRPDKQNKIHEGKYMQQIMQIFKQNKLQKRRKPLKPPTTSWRRSFAQLCVGVLAPVCWGGAAGRVHVLALYSDLHRNLEGCESRLHADKQTKTSSFDLETRKGQQVINRVFSFSSVAVNCVSFSSLWPVCIL